MTQLSQPDPTTPPAGLSRAEYVELMRKLDEVHAMFTELKDKLIPVMEKMSNGGLMSMLMPGKRQ